MKENEKKKKKNHKDNFGIMKIKRLIDVWRYDREIISKNWAHIGHCKIYRPCLVNLKLLGNHTIIFPFFFSLSIA